MGTQARNGNGKRASAWSYFDRSATDDFVFTVYEGGDGAYSMGTGGERVVAACDDEETAAKIAAVPCMVGALRDELDALRVWAGASGIPGDVREGISISIGKVEAALERAGVRA